MNMLAASRSSNRLRHDAGQQRDMKTEWGSFKDLMRRTSLLKYIYIFRFTFSLCSFFPLKANFFTVKQKKKIGGGVLGERAFNRLWISDPLKTADFCLRTVTFQWLSAVLSIYNEVLAGRVWGNHSIKLSLHCICFELRTKPTVIS